MIINKIYAHTYHMSAYTYTACVYRVCAYMYNYIVLYHIILYDIYIYMYVCMYVITLVCRGLPNVPFLFILNMSFNQLLEIISSNTHMLRAHTHFTYIYIYICRTPPKDIRVYSFFTVVGFYGSIFWWVPMYIYILNIIYILYYIYIYLSAIFVAAPGNLKIGGFRVLFQNRWGPWLDHQARLSWAHGIDEFNGLV